MPASIGVNLRVTGHCSQGGRKYMEDLFSVAYQQTEDERDLEYAFFGIYDGHGGSEAAAFAKEHLMDSIVKQRQFWSDNDEDVLKAIRNGYMLTHLNMWKELEKWPKTVTGLPSTAGTTASVAFIRRGKIYIGHVGDSAIVLGYQKDGCEEWAAKPLTSDHKPESTMEIERIQRCGGKVVSKAGVPRVVWNRPRPGHKGPIKKNTPMDEIPFLAVARSLGDLWSYNPQNDEFIVSPDPDVGVLTIDASKFRCLIFGTDGLWNMISPEGAVSLVQATEKHNEAALVGGNASQPRDWLNPSKSLVDHALERWSNTRMRADNTSVVTLMLDPPGPPRATVLRSRTGPQRVAPPTPAPTPAAAPALAAPPPEPRAPDADLRPVPQNGLTIMTRYSDAERATSAPAMPLPPCATLDARLSVAPLDDTARDDSTSPDDSDALTTYGNPAESYFMTRLLTRTHVVNTLAAVPEEISRTDQPESEPLDLQNSVTHVPETPPPPAEPDAPEPVPSPTLSEIVLPDAAGDRVTADDGGIQINEVSSSSPTEAPQRSRGRRPRSEARREEAAAANDRVLRSHHDHEVSSRPNTRQAATRSRPAPPAPPVPDRIVILNRRATPQPSQPSPVPSEIKQTPLRKPIPVEMTGDDDDGRHGARATRSQSAAATPLAQKITRSIGAYARELRGVAAGAGNSSRAPGSSRRAPAARRQGARSKENLGVAKGRVRARVAPVAPSPPPPPPPPRPRPRRTDSARDEHEVHSTTLLDSSPACATPPPPPPPPAAHSNTARALRSRNEATPPVQSRESPGCKRSRKPDETESSASKVCKVAPERCARALGKRSSGPWAPALALRNRLRRRLGK